MPGPNILWIVTTQWRAQAFGFAGDPNARTPSLDRLATESINYRQAVTPHPFGPFARAALFTGVLSPANGLVGYFDPLPVGTSTIADDLNALGYTTAFFGKWHLGRRDPQAALVGEAHARVIVSPAGRGGFQFWEGFESGFLLNDAWLHGTRLETPTQFPGYQSDVLCSRAASWVNDRSAPNHSLSPGTTPPFFCVVSLEAPHPPYDAPAAGVAPRALHQIALAGNVPLGGIEEQTARKELVGYYAHIEATDRAIGRLLQAVDDSNTVVLFTSVHGDMHGAHGLFRKGWPYEESVRVPLLVRNRSGRGEPVIDQPRDSGDKILAGERGRGQHSDVAVSLVDLRAMTRNWAENCPTPLKRASAAISMPSVVALPHQCDRVWRGVRSKTRKLVLNADGTPWLFFDLENDPLEMKNLVDVPGRPAEMERLKFEIEPP